MIQDENTQLCTSRWRAATQEASTFIRRNDRWIYIILLCPHAEYYFAQPEVRRNLSFVHIKALALLTRFSPAFAFFPPQTDLHFMNAVASKVHCLINEQCAPQQQARQEKTGECHETRKLPAEHQTQFWPPRITNWIYNHKMMLQQLKLHSILLCDHILFVFLNEFTIWRTNKSH